MKIILSMDYTNISNSVAFLLKLSEIIIIFGTHTTGRRKALHFSVQTRKMKNGYWFDLDTCYWLELETKEGYAKVLKDITITECALSWLKAPTMLNRRQPTLSRHEIGTSMLRSSGMGQVG